MAQKTRIELNWDSAGKINTIITGVSFPEPRRNLHRLIAPNAILLLAHQLGVFKPSKGLATCNKIIGIFFQDARSSMSINPDLKSVSLETIYDSPVKFSVYPKQKLFANGDHVEDGMGQLINDFLVHVFVQADEILQFVLRRTASVTVELYYRFIEQEIKNGHVGMGMDSWNPSFSLMADRLIREIVSNWTVPIFESSDQFNTWKDQELDFRVSQEMLLAKKRDHIFEVMGMN